MENLKEGSIIQFEGSDNSISNMEVLGICGKVIFVSNLLSDGAKEPVEMRETQDLVTMGWKLKS